MEPIRLDMSRQTPKLHDQIDDLHRDGKLPMELAICLQNLVQIELANLDLAFFPSTETPQISPLLVEQARKFLQGGIVFGGLSFDAREEIHFDVVVLVPENPDKANACFKMVGKYPGFRQVQLQDIKM